MLVDARTVDETANIARQYTEQVHVVPFESFPRFRNRALGLAQTEWVFFVDADERVPAALAAEVRTAVAGRPWTAPRATGCPGPIAFGGSGCAARLEPRLPVALAAPRRRALRHQRARPEVAALDGPAGWLHEPLIHLNYDTLGEFVAKQRRYAALEAWTRWQQGERVRARAVVGQPAREFWRRYVTLGGRQDGALGLVLAAYLAYAAWLRTRRLARLWRERGTPTDVAAAHRSSATVPRAVTGSRGAQWAERSVAGVMFDGQPEMGGYVRRADDA